MTKKHASKRSSEEKRRLCKELALLFIAQTIVNTFLTKTTTLALPPDWTAAMEVLRRNGDVAKTKRAVKKFMRRREDAEVVVWARKDARVLSFAEVAGGRIV
ncbi:hypothetical protein LTR91_019341 [Friedmanniomyces endolithicus]|uniref:Uncharacterized protein n=1 Tax=Friedmanniomyces endolithicus TaxID=329885 RepID=A0A4U0VGT5_9PEZI|nr:hypothetical protein LTS09_014801 [Friedmanniomyces endolithicus]KAK0271255.1 hypothetical protein LTR35_013571 [Friedmanniomyces endolithicus]KAK0277347.1 hypothetical protein LTS00_014181 [Friedmanniomyces endolithicus]KAK0308816.1 hypothetical protein LTR01_004695 [Friedmanniomyces endolithicus]KAK0325656.1 hypothetical protein LTR82_003192 [Friedmanniomyces endolithicus]